MNEFFELAAIFAVLLMAVAVFVLVKAKRVALRNGPPGYPAGHFQGRGMAIGIAIGAGMGAAMDNVAIGTGVGVAIGAAIGQQMERKHRHEIRPRTPEEEALTRKARWIALGALALSLIALLVILYGVR